MKYQDFFSDENVVSSGDAILSFTFEDITVVMATSVSANRKKASQHHFYEIYMKGLGSRIRDQKGETLTLFWGLGRIGIFGGK